MTVLLDECVPKVLRQALLPHEVSTPKMAGLSGVRNGQLLALAQERFDAFLTVDKGIVYQHPHGRFALRIVCVRSVTNRAADVLPYAGLILDAFHRMVPGEVHIIERLPRAG